MEAWPGPQSSLESLLHEHTDRVHEDGVCESDAEDERPEDDTDEDAQDLEAALLQPQRTRWLYSVPV